MEVLFNYVIFLLLLVIDSQVEGESPKISLSGAELRYVIQDLVQAEINANLPPSNAQISSAMREKLLKIQQSLNETERKTNEMIRNFQELKLGNNCGKIVTQLSTTSQGQVQNGTFRHEIRSLSSELANIRQSLERIQASTTTRGVTPVESVPTTSATARVPQRRTLNTHEFARLLSSKPVPAQGKTYNGTSIDNIATEVAENAYNGNSLTVEISNYLSRPIDQLDYHLGVNCLYHYPPTSIPANTKEVFTFREPSSGYQTAAFSYRIPNKNVRIAGVIKFEELEGDDFALEFVSENTSMSSHYNQASTRPDLFRMIDGQMSRREFIRSEGTIHARATLNIRGLHTGSLNIDIVGTL